MSLFTSLPLPVVHHQVHIGVEQLLPMREEVLNIVLHYPFCRWFSSAGAGAAQYLYRLSGWPQLAERAYISLLAPPLPAMSDGRHHGYVVTKSEMP